MNILPPKIKLPVTALLLALLIGGCNSLPWVTSPTATPQAPVAVTEAALSAEGRLVPLHSSVLSFQSGGELGELLVSKGAVVAQGDVLARLGKREPLQASLSQAKLEQLSAQQALDELKNTAILARQQAGQALVEARLALSEAVHTLDNLDTADFRQELDDRKVDLQDAKKKLDDAQEELDKNKDLDPDNTKRKNAQTAYDDALLEYNNALYERDKLQNQLDQAQAAVDLADARLKDAQRQYDNRKDGVDPDTLALAEARLALAQSQVAAAQRLLNNTDLVAPYRGTVVDLHDLEPGVTIPLGQPVVTIADYSTWMVETRDLTEHDVVKVKPGQDVQVVPDALPDLKLSGTVESIDRFFTERSGDILYTVRIKLNDSDPRLYWGMTVNAVFEH